MVKQTKKTHPDPFESVSIPLRKWINEGVTYKKGRFSETEEKLLQKSLCDFALENKMSLCELLEMMSHTLPEKNKKVWNKIAEALPNRSILAVQNFCKRRFHPNNYKRNWTSEEETELKAMVTKTGFKWSELATHFQRTRHNVRDKWRSIGAQDEKGRVDKNWSLNEILRLMRIVEKYNSLQLLSNTDRELIEDFKKSNRKFLKGELLISSVNQHNKILSVFLRSKIINQVSTLSFSWTEIAESFKHRSIDDLKNIWRSIFGKSNNIWEQKRIKDNLQILKKLHKNKVSFIKNIQFDNLRILNGENILEKIKEEVKLDFFENFKKDVVSSIEFYQKKLETLKPSIIKKKTERIYTRSTRQNVKKHLSEELMNAKINDN